MRFHGKTEMRNSIYHNCYIYPADEVFNPSSAVIYCYAREIDGKIYTYWPESLPSIAETLDYSKYQLYKHNVFEDELLSYDFSLNENEDYHLIKDFSKRIHAENEYTGYYPDCGYWWKIGSKTSTTLGRENEEVSVFRIVSGLENKYIFTAVEGVGRISGFCNFMPMPVWQLSHMNSDCEDGNSIPPRYILFNNLYDDEENVIFKGAGLKEGDSYDIRCSNSQIPIEKDIVTYNNGNIYAIEDCIVRVFNIQGGEIFNKELKKDSSINLKLVNRGIYIILYESTSNSGHFKIKY